MAVGPQRQVTVLVTLLLLSVLVVSAVLAGSKRSACHSEQPQSKLLRRFDWLKVDGEEQVIAAAAQPRPASHSSHFAVWIFHSWNKPMFMQCFSSLLRAGFTKRVIVLDNSLNLEAATDPAVVQAAMDVYATPARLTFAQMHNLAAKVSAARGFSFYFWSHADAVVMPTREEDQFAEQALQCVEEAFSEEGQRWGAIFFRLYAPWRLPKDIFYDHFAAFRVEAALEVDWDVYIPHYGADCDHYKRMRAAGWAEKRCGRGIVFDTSEPHALSGAFSKDMQYLLERYRTETHSRDRNKWRDSQLHVSEVEGRLATQDAGWQYYTRKWGTRSCDLPDDAVPWSNLTTSG